MEQQTRIINEEQDRSSELSYSKTHTLSIRCKERSPAVVCAESHPLPLSLRLPEKKLYASARKPPSRR